MPETQSWTVSAATSGAVLAALRRHCAMTWSAARRLMSEHRILVNGILCSDEGRRVVEGDVLEVRSSSLPAPPRDAAVRILFLDESLVVAEKPSGMLSVRHPGDLEWRQERKDRQPSMEECLQRLIPAASGRARKRSSEELLIVHRIDRETSGILVFARTEPAWQDLVSQFAAHSAERLYFCVVPGWLPPQTIASRQLRDRGDGLRGSDPEGLQGKHMVTHVRPLRQLGDYSELQCQLETGRTNQIRIHLAEAGFPLCGDVKYRGPFGKPPIIDTSEAPRLALHAATLGFRHPVTGEQHRYQRPWPADMRKFLQRLESRARSRK